MFLQKLANLKNNGRGNKTMFDVDNWIDENIDELHMNYSSS